jgi:hypothetical protein
MKISASLALLLILLTGCVNRPVRAALPSVKPPRKVIPQRCITHMSFSKQARCYAGADGSFRCDGIVLQAACVKVVKD